MDRAAKMIGSGGTALLRRLDPEMSHDLVMGALERGLLDRFRWPRLAPSTAGLRVSLPGIGELGHPIGLAAGFDKNCRAPRAFARMGFSFIEAGTVTLRPQPGNPKPRLFRLPGARALVNRMGFNNDGARAVADRLSGLSWRHDLVPLGVNVGKNKDTPAEKAVSDYVATIDAFGELAKYFVVNISSPNTPGLRQLATPAFLQDLAGELAGKLPRVWVKLDPDLAKGEFQKVVEAVATLGFQGLILTNTHRVERPEAGGLSGVPLLVQATTCLEWAFEVHRGKLPMIGVGGILSGGDVFQKIARGASAVQIYTALVYRGPWVVAELLAELGEELRLRGISRLADAIGCHYD